MFFCADRNYGILRLGTGSLQGALEGALAVQPPLPESILGGGIARPSFLGVPPQISMGPKIDCFMV